jgi:hypothetical protein
VYLCVSGYPPPSQTFAVFGSAAIFTYALALLSIDRVRQVLPSSVWRAFRTIGMNYIAFAFILDFTKFSFSSALGSLLYLPFAAFAVAAPSLKLAAWVRKLTQARRPI